MNANTELEIGYATKSHANATPEIQEGLPLYMREGGEEEIDFRRKELETYVKMLGTCPREIISRTFIILNPHTLNPNEVGQEEATAIETWWKDPRTQRGVIIWLESNKHKVNGKYGNWSCGYMGSRWADCEINTRNCRFAFYSRKHNPTSFPAEMDEHYGKKYNYAIMIDPTN